MKAEQEYIDLFSQCEALICRHSSEVMNAPRAKAFARIFSSIISRFRNLFSSLLVIM